jgi:DnaK suppressor protein
MTTRFIPIRSGPTFDYIRSADAASQDAASQDAASQDRPQQVGYLLQEQRRFRLTQLAELTATAGASEELAAVQASLSSAARVALAEVDAALARLAQGSYGRCAKCGQEIAGERLEILPMAALCMPCQQQQEFAAEHGQRPGG